MAATLAQRLEHRAWYLVAREVWRALRGTRDRRRSPNHVVVPLRPAGPSRGNVLLCYRIEPYVRKPGEPFPTGHTNYWATCQMATTFLELGYAVDVISYRNEAFVPRKRYAVVLDCRRILERIAPLLDERCIKVMYLDTAHALFHDAAEARRLLALQRRRGVTLAPVRYEVPNLGLEHADCGVMPGNVFTLGTYAYAGKPIYRVPVPSSVAGAWPADKDFGASRRRFMFLSSHGLVHKGLDLVLEAFAQMPEYRLTVCGPVDREKDFVQAYRRELYTTPNIETAGWIDTEGPEFLTLARGCVAMISASCSEGASTSVIECMHAALIPIVTYESGVDACAFGVTLKGDTIADIKEAVATVAALPADELERRARAAWDHARANHTRERFAEVFRTTMEMILATFARSP